MKENGRTKSIKLFCMFKTNVSCNIRYFWKYIYFFSKKFFFYKNVLDVFRPSAGIGGHLRQLMAFLGNTETKACFGLLALQVSSHGLDKLGVFWVIAFQIEIWFFKSILKCQTLRLWPSWQGISGLLGLDCQLKYEDFFKDF